MPRLALALLAVALTSAVALPGAAAASDPLAAYRGRERVLVVSARDPADPALRAQRDAFAAMGAAARDRDLVLVEAIGATPRARAIRAAVGIDTEAFAAVLVGKDGGPKLRSASALGADRLVPTIDAMPMRLNEMNRKP